MRDLAQLDIDPSAMKGRADLRVNIPLTIKNIPDLQDLPISVTGALSDLTIDKVFGKDRLEGASLSVGYQNGGLAIRGGGRIAGVSGDHRRASTFRRFRARRSCRSRWTRRPAPRKVYRSARN